MWEHLIINAGKTNHKKTNSTKLYKKVSVCTWLHSKQYFHSHDKEKQYRLNEINIPFIYNCVDRGQYLLSKIDD